MPALGLSLTRRAKSFSVSSSTPSMSSSLGLPRMSSFGPVTKKASLAVTVLREAIIIRRDLAHIRPTVFNCELAASLQTLSEYLSDDAMSMSEGSTFGGDAQSDRGIPSPGSSPFMSRHPHLPSFDSTMTTTSTNITIPDRETQKEALDAIHEAVTLRRKLASAWPALYTPILAGSLKEFARRLDEMDLVEEAEMARQEEAQLSAKENKDKDVGVAVSVPLSPSPSFLLTPPTTPSGLGLGKPMGMGLRGDTKKHKYVVPPPMGPARAASHWL